MILVITVVVVLVVVTWIARLGKAKHVITDRKEMRRLSRKIQSSEKYRSCGED